MLDQLIIVKFRCFFWHKLSKNKDLTLNSNQNPLLFVFGPKTEHVLPKPNNKTFSLTKTISTVFEFGFEASAWYVSILSIFVL